MICPKCKSQNVNTQIIQDVTVKDKHHGFLWWICVGWLWVPFKWLFLTLPALIVKLFGHKKQKVTTKQKNMCVCQNCGYTWEV